MNILYLHTHDSGRILSPYGYQVPTPALSAFAKDALMFRQAYCVSPTCSPSRSSLLSGVYPHQNGMLGLAQRGFHMDMKLHFVNLVNQQGYHSVLCGIQHESGNYLHHKEGAATIGYHEDITRNAAGYQQEELVLWDQKNALAMCEWLRGYDRKKPFFASYGMYATHRRYPPVDSSIDANQLCPPYPIPDTPTTREDHAGYLSSAKSADSCVEQILHTLQSVGLYEDTIIIFTTDHGLANPFCKCTLFDSGVGVAFLMHVPGSSANGQVCDEMISHLDVVPTLCDLLQLPKPSYLMGTSFASVFYNPKAAIGHDVYMEVNFHTSYEPIRAIRTSRYKYIRYYDPSYLAINYSNIDESKSKDYFMENDLERCCKYEEALYDVVYDMGERCNLIHSNTHQAIIKELATKLDANMRNTQDPLLLGPIALKSEWKVNKKTCLQASSTLSEDYESLGK